MTQRSGHLSDDDLLRILDHDGGADASWAHLDICHSCQSRVTQLAGKPDYWVELRDMLKPSAEDDGDSGVLVRRRAAEPSQRSNSDHSVIKNLLSPPSHPEMFGRLDRYEIERVIGAGGMGVVMKGYDTELNRPVAVKLLASHLANRGTAKQRFAREARAAAAIVHEHVVSIFNVASEADVPYLVMQYIDGESLQDRVDRCGVLGTEEILRMGMQVAAGLAAAHQQGVIHRDIKPANILVEGGLDRALLSDFGLARIVDDASLTQSGALTGTPHYMSPEQAAGEVAQEASDLFSLGSVLYFMAVGHPPFRAERPMAVLDRIRTERHRAVWRINEDIPDALSDLIDRLLEKKPRRRVPSAAEASRMLGDILASKAKQRRARSTYGNWNWVALVSTFAAIMLLAFAGPPIVQFIRRPTKASVKDTFANPGSDRFLSDKELRTQPTWKSGSLPSGTTNHVYADEGRAGVILGLPNTSDVAIVVRGEDHAVVHTLVDRRLQPGEHKFDWNFDSAKPGVYSLSIVVEGQSLTQSIEVPPGSRKPQDPQDDSLTLPRISGRPPAQTEGRKRGFPMSDILEQPWTALPDSAVGTDAWRWPEFQRALLELGAMDGLILDRNEVRVSFDNQVLTINRARLDRDKAKPYLELFAKFEIPLRENWLFQKQGNNIIKIDSIADTTQLARQLLSLLVKLGALSDFQEEVKLELPGPRFILNGRQLSDEQAMTLRGLLNRHAIQPVPGKTILLNSRESSRPNGVGYIDGNGDFTAGTFWPQ